VYTDRAHEIFTPTGVIANAKRVAEGFMYDPNHLKKVLVDVLGPAANWTVNDSPIRVMISATAMDGHNWFFVKDNDRNAKTTGKVKLIVISLGTGYYPASDDPPNGLIATIGWVTGTLIDSSEDWVDNAVERQWPAILQNFNPELPHDIDMADIDAVPELVEIGNEMAADIDWTTLLR
jgi:hypothetical protein